MWNNCLQYSISIHVSVSDIMFRKRGGEGGGAGGGSRSRFTENKLVLSQFPKNEIGILRFTKNGIISHELTKPMIFEKLHPEHSLVRYLYYQSASYNII